MLIKYVNNSAECPFRKEPSKYGPYVDPLEKAYCWAEKTDCYFDGGMDQDICPLMKKEGLNIKWKFKNKG